MRRTLAHPIAPRRRAVELPLVAEGVVEALAPDTHGAHEHLRRSALKPVLAEHADRAIERRVRIKFPGSCHKGLSSRSGTIIQVYYRGTRLLVMVRRIGAAARMRTGTLFCESFGSGTSVFQHRGASVASIGKQLRRPSPIFSPNRTKRLILLRLTQMYSHNTCCKTQ